jgi:hypothetical protein
MTLKELWFRIRNKFVLSASLEDFNLNPDPILSGHNKNLN